MRHVYRLLCVVFPRLAREGEKKKKTHRNKGKNGEEKKNDVVGR